MFLEVKVPTEALLTDPAVIGFFVVVRVHVEREIVHLEQKQNIYLSIDLLYIQANEKMVKKLSPVYFSP